MAGNNRRRDGHASAKEVPVCWNWTYTGISGVPVCWNWTYTGISGVPRNLFRGGGGFRQKFFRGGGGGQQIQLRTEDRENGDLGAVVRGSTQFANE
jgi:hypothetical protein